jgi:hypothetical protein
MEMYGFADIDASAPSSIARQISPIMSPARTAKDIVT